MDLVINNQMFVELEIDLNKMLGMGKILRELNIDFDDLISFGR